MDLLFCVNNYIVESFVDLLKKVYVLSDVFFFVIYCSFFKKSYLQLFFEGIVFF